jgi:hypothetical protein
MTSFSNAMMEMGFERLTGMSVPASARSALAIDRDDTLWAAFRFLLQVREHHSDRHTGRHHFTPTPPSRKKKKKSLTASFLNFFLVSGSIRTRLRLPTTRRRCATHLNDRRS